MCRQNCCSQDPPAAGGAVTADESLLIYCKPVELYNILRGRTLSNPCFLRRCLRYKTKSSRKRRRMTGIVIFNYKDYNNMLRKTEVTEDFSCPFCLLQCVSFKGLRFHLCSSHDLFDFEFWATEDYQAVNVSVKIDRFKSETIADGVKQRQQTFSFCSRKWLQRSRNPDLRSKQVSIEFLELDSSKVASEITKKVEWWKHDAGNEFKSSSDEIDVHDVRLGTENHVPGQLGVAELIERVGSSSDVPDGSVAKVQSSLDPDCNKLQSECDPSVPMVLHVAKSRKLTMERGRVLLQKRQFYHSHRVQPMALEQVMSDRDSEDEVDDDIADFDDRRMLDDFVDVSNDEKQLMHLWNSFVRKQRVIADGHIPWACEAFSKLHERLLISSAPLFWCWRLLMIKLWNHGLLDASTMNNCSTILEAHRIGSSDTIKSDDGGDEQLGSEGRCD